ncbi:MAG: tyrosine-type recombinase/integrase [Gammaproteobacteria bacterium]|nr:tyrosine-type recombinase/integrase [Gammaproteobacteria bacterium]MYK32680.1 tyrosine-type recombinase/integrase [Boseongicola sp. SB0670_bin_30]
MNDVDLLGPWLRRFLTEHIVSERNLAINTRQNYRDTFALLLPFASADIRKPVDRLSVSDLTSDQVLKFLAHLEEVRGCSVQTRNQRLVAIRSFASFVGHREPAFVEWCGKLRAVPMKRAATKPIEWLSRTEIDALLTVPDCTTPQGRNEHGVLLFLYNSGARVSEAVQLRKTDLQIDRRDGGHALVNLHGKGGKIRQCPLWPRTEKVLTSLMKERTGSETVFHSRYRKPYTRFGVYHLVARNAAAVPSLSGRRVTPHVIRHSTACHLLQAGVDINTIRAWLGHVSLETTNIYAEIDLEMKARALALCDAAEPVAHRPWKEDDTLMAFLKAL